MSDVVGGLNSADELLLLKKNQNDQIEKLMKARIELEEFNKINNEALADCSKKYTGYIKLLDNIKDDLDYISAAIKALIADKLEKSNN